MREVAAEFERPVLLFSGGKDSIVLLRIAEKAFRPASIPVPADAHRHGPQLPRGDRVPRPADGRARRAADRRLGPGLDRPRPGRRGAGPAGVAQPAPDDDAARRDRGAPLRRGVRRRPPRRGALPGQGADPLLPRRLRPVGSAQPAARAVEPLQLPDRAAASTPGSSRSPTGPSSTSGSTSSRRPSRSPSLYFAHERDVFERDGMLYAHRPGQELAPGEEVFAETVRYRTVGDMTCTGASDRRRRRSPRWSPRSPRR